MLDNPISDKASAREKYIGSFSKKVKVELKINYSVICVKLQN